MKRSLLLVVFSLSSLAATPAVVPVGEAPRLVSLTLTAGAGVDESVASSLSESVTGEVSRLHLFKVVSQSELRTLLGFERQKQLLGCSETTNCMAEMADAMGARFVLSGSLTRLGETFQLNLQVVDSHTTQALGRATRFATTLEALRAQLPWAVAEATGAPPPQRASKVPSILLMSSGGAAVVVGGVLWLQSVLREELVLNELKLAQAQSAVVLMPLEHYRAERDAIVGLRVAGSIAVGVGAALLATGALVLPGENDVVRVAVVPNATGVTLVGEFP